MKGYVIATIRVDDAEAYEAYRSRTGAVIESFGGRFLVRGGQVEPREGEMAHDRVVVIEFPSMDRARAFYDSDAYQAIVPIRKAHADSRLFLVEGVAEA